MCPDCGYAIEADFLSSKVNETKLFKEKHRTQTGKPCNRLELIRRSLGYQFKTDVVRIKIRRTLSPEANSFEQAYSILQALILSASEMLDIDYSEISGCLQYYADSFANFSYILYDRTPGGAGHVKRLNNEFLLRKVLQEAYDRCKSCSCGGEEGGFLLLFLP